MKQDTLQPRPNFFSVIRNQADAVGLRTSGPALRGRERLREWQTKTAQSPPENRDIKRINWTEIQFRPTSGAVYLTGVATKDAPSASTPHSPRRAVMNDPMVGILASFEAIPAEHRDALFADFRAAAEARNLRQLQDAISDWAATGELYANPDLAKEVEEAIGNRTEVADWLPG